MHKNTIILGVISIALVAAPSLVAAQTGSHPNRVCVPVLRQLTGTPSANAANTAAARTQLVIKNRCDAQTDNLKATSRTGGAPLTVSFTATIPAGEPAGSTYAVDFGDGSTAAVSATPGTYTLSHVYVQPGTFKASLIETTPSTNTQTTLGKANVFVGTIAPVKAPKLSKLIAPAYLKVGQQGVWKVGDSVASGQTTFTVAWGDGTTSSGNASSTANMGVFKHLYANPGTYTPTFTATNAAGSVTVTYPVLVVARAH